MKIKLLILLALLFGTKTLAVVNGTQVENNEETEVVKLVGMNQAHTEYWRCSGVFISKNLVLTAGHCLQGAELEAIYLYTRTDQAWSKPIRGVGYTEFTDDLEKALDPGPQDPEAVPGCFTHPIPLVKTKTLDLALIHFQSAPSGERVKISDQIPEVGETLTTIGYGSENDPFEMLTQLLDQSETFKVHKKSFRAKVWRMNEQRLGIKTTEAEAYAAYGDSGAPIFSENRKLVAIMSSVSPSCETKFGSDYGPLNTATLLGNEEAKSFIRRGKKYLTHHRLTGKGIPLVLSEKKDE